MSTTENTTSSDKKCLRIIYVDDDADDRGFFEQSLARLELPCECRTLSSCENLFEVLRKEHPCCDMIFLDINMPKQNGLSCLKQIKELEQFREIPVIIFSVSQHPDDIEESYTSGAHYHVVKPHANINYLASLKSVLISTGTSANPFRQGKSL